MPAPAPAPDQLPLPVADGLTWRALEAADAPAIHALVAKIEDADGQPFRTSLAEVEEEFDSPGRNPVTDTLGAVDRTGRIHAYGAVDTRPGDERVRRAFVPADARLFERAGFTARRYYATLRRDLTVPIPAVELEAGLRLEPWSPAVDESTRLAHNDAFRDHWGSQPQAPELRAHGRSLFAPQWSFVVVDPAPDPTALADPGLDAETRAHVAAGGALVVGYHLADRAEQDWAVQGYTSGYTDALGVRRSYRGRRIAPALLAAGMRAYAADGVQYAVLDVDTENPTGAYGLYSSLGYQKTVGSRMLSIEL